MQTSIALVGVGGYGAQYLKELLSAAPDRNVRLVAGIDPFPERSPLFDELKQAAVPIFSDLNSFYRQGSADLVILAVPIQFHAPLTCLALSQGSHVLCEKPLGASLSDAQQMLDAEKSAGKRVAIGYQWSFSEAVLSLKKQILAGRFGRPLNLKTLLLWTRSHAYYQRNDWAARIRTQDGTPILDSPVNNATAHYLHNMLFLLGSSIDRSACPLTLQSELYRANAIENYDTAALRVKLDTGVNLLFLTTQPVLVHQGPWSQFEFEDARIEFADNDRQFRAHFRNGQTECYGRPDADPFNKLWQTVQAIQTGRPLVCGIQAALPHLQCVLGAQETPIHDFPPELVRLQKNEADQTTWVDGLSEIFQSCYQHGQLPSEVGAAWAVKPTLVDLQKFSL